MEREILLGALVPLVCGPSLFLAAWMPTWRRDLPRDSTAAEQQTWHQLWLRVLPATFAWAVLLGWALVEQDPSDETLSQARLLLVAVLVVPWIRAAVRAVQALRAPKIRTAATMGILRPRVILNPAYAATLDPRALDAVLSHERAHAHHRDPLRVWLAGIATDLQWPAPAARRRMEVWQSTLERVRDDQARWSGSDGAALASAIVAAARWEHANPACGVSGGHDLADRVARLLEPAPPPDRPHQSVAGYVWLGALVLGFALGLWFGDPIVRLILGAA